MSANRLDKADSEKAELDEALKNVSEVYFVRDCQRCGCRKEGWFG